MGDVPYKHRVNFCEEFIFVQRRDAVGDVPYKATVSFVRYRAQRSTA